MAPNAAFPKHLPDFIGDVAEDLLANDMRVVVRPPRKDFIEVSNDILGFRLLVGVQPRALLCEECVHLFFLRFDKAFAFVSAN